MKSALEEAGFFSDTTPHKLIMLGDLFDRGQDVYKRQQDIQHEDVVPVRLAFLDLFTVSIPRFGISIQELGVIDALARCV